jgi:hypothetical protein
MPLQAGVKKRGFMQLVAQDQETACIEMGIRKYYKYITDDFEIFGQYDERWEPCNENVEYEAFLVKRKLVKFE